MRPVRQMVIDDQTLFLVRQALQIIDICEFVTYVFVGVGYPYTLDNISLLILVNCQTIVRIEEDQVGWLHSSTGSL
jgi:hypothetical protein